MLSLNGVLGQADTISLHVPLTHETRGFIVEVSLREREEGAMLVNTSRGPLVDLETLRKALETGRLSAAALDVFDFVPVDPTRIQGIPT